MPEVTSFTGQAIASDVRAKFGDSGNVQINDTLILSWINNGARRIAAVTPWLKAIKKVSLLAGIGTYDLTTGISPAVHTYDSMTANGYPVKIVTWAEFQDAIASNGIGDQQSTDAQIAAEYGGQLSIWPIPAATVADGLIIYYTALPVTMTDLGALLPVPDRFFNALNDYVLQQALELGDDFQNAEVKRQHSEAQIREQMEQQGMSPTAFYPTIVEDPEDYA